MKSIIVSFLGLLFVADQIFAQSWRPLDQGTNGVVEALCIDSIQNELYVGGQFTSAGGLKVMNLAKWDGNEWHKAPDLSSDVSALLYYKGHIYVALYDGEVGYVQNDDYISIGFFNDYVTCIAIYKDTLYAGGDFTEVNEVNANRVAKWNGKEWQPLGNGVNGAADPGLFTLHEYNGDLIAGGLFETAGDSSAKNIARWDGHDWHSLRGGVFTSADLFTFTSWVNALDTFQDALMVGGKFEYADSIQCNSLATWNGFYWDTLAYLLSNEVLTFFNANNKLYASGYIYNGAQFWDGYNWKDLNWGGYGLIYAFQFFNGRLYSGGAFNRGDSVKNIAYLDYTTQTPRVNTQSLTVLPNPANTFLNVTFNINKQSHLLITDQYGKIVKSESVSPSSKNKIVDLSNLPRGVYMVTLESAGERWNEKVVIEK